MNQEDKDLLLRDLCGRLPYGVKVHKKNSGLDGTLIDTELRNGLLVITTPEISVCTIAIEKVKPYLRPMSSMTMEDLQNLSNAIGLGLAFDDKKYELWLKGHTTILDNSLAIDWLNSHHFDYRGLIKCRLALKAPEDMYN